MGQVIRPGSSTSDGQGRAGQPVFLVRALSQYGFRGFIAMVVAAVFAFLPLAALIWFNSFQFTAVISAQCAVRVVVKERFESRRHSDQPGKTGLLQITCEVPVHEGWQQLLRDNDPSRGNRDFIADSIYVRDERVYLRKAGNDKLPFGLLGRPPISAWVPEGEYEIAVVHEMPVDRMRVDAPQIWFPFVTMYESCSVRNWERTVVTVQLPHYDWGNGAPISLAGGSNDPKEAEQASLKELLKSLEETTAIPTPGGYVLYFSEPRVTHADEHRGCTIDFNNPHEAPREWTRNQLAVLRNRLPETATAAREKLSPLIANLLRREALEGWFFYALAGVSGLVLTNWGSLAILEPFRRRELFSNSVTFCLFIFLVAAAFWWYAGMD